MTPLQSERQQFSERLLHGIDSAGLPTSPTGFTRVVNAQSGQAPLSVVAIRKWLTGSSLPRQPMLVVLAKILKVDPAWLRFGQTSSGVSDVSRHAPAPKLTVITDDLSLLSNDELQAVSALVETLLNIQTIRPLSARAKGVS